MNYCPACGEKVTVLVPPGDHLPRHVCTVCKTVHYQNPRFIVGCIPEWEGKILLCRRAIEPRLGFWTFPAGFMENGETLQSAAARESMEEALANVAIGSMLAIVHVLHAAQVHVIFRARLLDTQIGAGPESLEVGLYSESEVPWNAIAFRSVDFALRRYFEDRKTGLEPLHFHDIDLSQHRPAT